MIGHAHSVAMLPLIDDEPRSREFMFSSLPRHVGNDPLMLEPTMEKPWSWVMEQSWQENNGRQAGEERDA